jgi:hypothetical protein
MIIVIVVLVLVPEIDSYVIGKLRQSFDCDCHAMSSVTFVVLYQSPIAYFKTISIGYKT